MLRSAEASRLALPRPSANDSTRRKSRAEPAQGDNECGTKTFEKPWLSGVHPRLGTTLSGVPHSGRKQLLRPARTPFCRLCELLKRGAPQNWDAPSLYCSTIIVSGLARALPDPSVTSPRSNPLRMPSERWYNRAERGSPYGPQPYLTAPDRRAET